MGSHRETSNMLTSLCLLCLCVLAVRADLNYGYSSPYDYSNYSAYSLTPAAASRTRRVFGAFSSDNPFTMEFTFDATIPMTDLNAAVEISVPFSFSVPTESSRRSSSGRSLTSPGAGAGDSVRSKMYRTLENYVGTFSGADGHHCLLRAMCEVGSNPFHDEGILGDVVNFLLTGNYVQEEEDERFQSYVTAQTAGQVSGDCSTYHKSCPLSFFKLITDNFL